MDNKVFKKIDKLKKSKLKYIFVIICIIIIIGIIVIIKTNFFNFKANTKEWKIKEIYVDKNEENTTATVPKFEDMTINEQFYEVIYNYSKYMSRKTEISSNNIEEKIESSILTNANHNKNADLYSIKNISSKCAIAVKFEGDNNYYVYTNIFYKPQTLKEFVEDLKLEKIISFGTVHYNYWEENEEGNKEYQNIEFYNVNNKKIWKMIFNNLDLENIYTDNKKYKSDKYATSIEISVDIPLLGYENISIELTDKGYLITNILDSGKAFYIGEEKIQEFLEYIKKNYEGYKIVYIYKNDNETKNEDKKDNENLQIVIHNMIDNTDTYINQTPNTMIDMSIENQTQHNISNSI